MFIKSLANQFDRLKKLLGFVVCTNCECGHEAAVGHHCLFEGEGRYLHDHLGLTHDVIGPHPLGELAPHFLIHSQQTVGIYEQENCIYNNNQTQKN